VKALVAMSGGVDSSVAAALMLDAGYDVIGVTLKQWVGPDGEMPTAGCCTVADAEDARRVAAQLGIRYYVLDYVDEFTEAVVEPFGEAYLAGRTPNPCIECNRRVRFAALFERMGALGADVLATGHHARVRRDRAGWHLLRAVDGAKDQSYVLHMLGQSQLSRILLPIGEMTKDDVREKAKTLGLRTAMKPDSQDICFVKRDYRSLLRTIAPEAARPGAIVDSSGTILGSHDGIGDFTIGQRRGLGVALGEPRYVVDVRPATDEVVVGSRRELLAGGCLVSTVSFVSGVPPADPQVEVKVRYRSKPVRSLIEPVGDEWLVTFVEPTNAPAPGQSAVFYDGDEVLGGGIIDRVVRSDG
jgi:tRNA-uridine 2-sulfurtransferase